MATSDLDQNPPNAFSAHIAKRLLTALRWPDAPLLIYFMAFSRQYTWSIEDQMIAWTISAAIACPVLLVHVAQRPLRGKGPSLSFWVIVGLPFLFMFTLRLPFPDINYDQMTYHLVNAERALQGWPFRSDEYFPGVMLPNPASDMVEGISRFLLGYRLGTIINLIAVLWTAVSLELLLRDYVLENTKRYAAVLFALTTEHSFYLLNLYMIDLLALPLIVDALYYVLNFEKMNDRKGYAIIHVAFFLGMSIAFKLTNIAVAIPLLALLAIKVANDRKPLRATAILAALLALAAPSLPFSLFMYEQTASPVFPYFNNLLHSPYFPSRAYRDELRGPRGVIESLFWPIWGTVESGRISAMDHGSLYLGKISLVYLLAAITSCISWFGRPIRSLSLLTLTMILLWSFGSGDIRYAISIEVIGGILIVCLASTIWKLKGYEKRLAFPAALMFFLFFGPQMVLIFKRGVSHMEFYTTDSDWDSISQPTAISQPVLYAEEAKNILFDRDPKRFIDEPTAGLLADVEVWINSIDATSAVEVAARPDVPIVSLGKAARVYDYMESPASRERLRTILENFRDKRMFTLVQVPDMSEATRTIQRSGLRIVTSLPIVIPFWSQYKRLKFLLIEVEFEG
jgi:hypothetical protein